MGNVGAGMVWGAASNGEMWGKSSSAALQAQLCRERQDLAAYQRWAALTATAPDRIGRGRGIENKKKWDFPPLPKLFESSQWLWQMSNYFENFQHYHTLQWLTEYVPLWFCPVLLLLQLWKINLKSVLLAFTAFQASLGDWRFCSPNTKIWFLLCLFFFFFLFN